MTKMYAALFTVRAWVEARMDVDRERGATMIEYGLLAGLVSIAALAALQVIGPDLKAIFDKVAAAL
jgi:pilus assembly protein Flp/PilA